MTLPVEETRTQPTAGFGELRVIDFFAKSMARVKGISDGENWLISARVVRDLESKVTARQTSIRCKLSRF